MKRWLVRIAVCLILGAVTTVAVAWGIAMSAPPMPIYSSSGIGTTTPRFGISVDLRRTDENNGVIAVHQAGIPLRALARHFRSFDPTNIAISGPGSARIQADHLEVIAAFRIPDAFVLPGFLIDTLFYAAIWFGVFFGFTSAKRFIRTRRGRCPQCGYDLRRNLKAGCPECGWGRNTD